jgi:hypothetical protein
LPRFYLGQFKFFSMSEHLSENDQGIVLAGH